MQHLKTLYLLLVLSLLWLLLLPHLLCTEDLGPEKELSALVYVAVGEGVWTSLKKSLAKAESHFPSIYPGNVLCAGGQ